MKEAMPPISFDEMWDEQRFDRECQRISQMVLKGHLGYELNEEGLLCKQMEGQKSQVLVPPRLREIILHMEHIPPQAAHPCARPMQANISREFYWASLLKDCVEYVRHQLSCAAVKGPGGDRTRPLQLLPPDVPWEFVCVDILGPLPTTATDNKFLLVICDRFSKFTVAIPLKSTKADVVAEVFVAHWVAYFGVPLVL
jgi:hypothetical protein